MNLKGLRFKLIVGVALSLLLLVLVQFIATQSLLLQGYSKLESDKTYMQVSNAKKLLLLQDQQLAGLTKDWAHWDDSYDYMVSHNQAYIDANYNNAVFDNLKINAIFIIDNQGKIIHQDGYDYYNNKSWAIPAQLTLAVSNNGVFTKPTKAGNLSGFLWTSSGLMLVSATDILPSNSSASRRGVLVMMRLIDHAFTQQLEALVGAKISISQLSDIKNDSDSLILTTGQMTNPNGWAMHALNKSEVAGYTRLPTVYAGNDMLLKTVSDREIFELGKNSANLILWSTAAIALVLIVLSVLFDKLVVARLSELSSSVNLINESADSAARIPAIAGNDELANLAQRINGMLNSLDEEKKALQDSEFRWKFALEGAGEGVWDWNMQTDAVEYSALWKHMFGYVESDVLPSKAEWSSFIYPEDQASFSLAMKAYLDGETSLYVAEYRVKRKDNTYLWVLGRGMIASYSEDGKPLRMLGTHTDISVRKSAELDLRVAATAFESQEAMFITDADLVILRVNCAFTVMTGYTAEEAVGQKSHLLRSGKHNEAFYQAMWHSLKTDYAWQGEIFNRRKNGQIYPELLTITAVKDDKGNVSHYVASFTDITLRKAAEEEISHLAFYDPLTGLPNRRLLLDRLSHSIASHERSHRAGAILFLDLDHFKTLNDTLGHDMGDLLLKQVALRLQSCVRDCDTVARLGGDEFVIMLENLSEQALEAASQTEDVGEKIIAMLSQPYQLANYEYRSTASVGAVIIKDSTQSPDEFLKQADIAMYQAKKAGRNTLRFFDPQMQANVNQQAEMEHELYNALEQQQLRLFYQAQVDISGHITGAEALLRWLHPERGLVSPLQFIPLAEDSGLILPIGLWVLKTACIQLQAWQQDPKMQNLEIAVNVSAKQLRQADFSAQVQALVKQYAIRPQNLKLELTESALLDNLENTISIMHELKELGVTFSLDDFGTGYSSLQYLKQLPISQLKIDQSFVRDIHINLSDDAIVRTIIAMANSLSLNVIAEGVETKAQRTHLKKNGCRHFQGYLFSKPVTIEAFQALVADSPSAS